LPGGQNVIDYLQRYCGYSLCGETIERCFLILHGIGANGKSTFIGVWSDILGDYAVDCPVEVFLKEKHELHRTYIVRLRGARLVVSSETDEDRKSTRLNSSHVAISYAVFCLKKKTIEMSIRDEMNDLV